MDPLQYIAEALADWPVYLGLLAVSLLVHWRWLLVPRTFGLFDPLFVVLLGSAFGWAIVAFMLWRGDIAARHALAFCSAELAFYGGLWLAGRSSSSAPPPSGPSREPVGFAWAVFWASAAMHLSATLGTWAIAGIPLLRVSRIGAFVGSGGLGLLERLADAGGEVALFTTLYLLVGNMRTRARLPCWLFLAWYAVALAASGSKSALLIAGQSAFAVAWLYKGLGRRPDNFWGGAWGKRFIVLATLFAIAVLGLQQAEGGIGLAVVSFAYRLVSFGDVYVFAYPGDAIAQLTGDNPLVGLFGGFLSTFRLFPSDALYTGIGYQFTLMTFPDIDYVSGPNPRHPVFGAHYFGALGFLFSFALGWITARLQRRLYHPRRRDYLHALISYLLYAALATISVDFELALGRLASFIIGLTLILLPALLLFPRHPLAPRTRRPSLAPS